MGTLLTIDNGVFEVLAINGDTHLAGEDFDQRVMQYFIKMMKKKSDVDISKDKRALQKLRKEVERVKRALSSQQQARLEIEDLAEGYDLSETLTRARFEELNADLFKKTLGPVGKVLADADVSKSEVDDIVLVGGSTRIPKVQSLSVNILAVRIHQRVSIQMRLLHTVLLFREVFCLVKVVMLPVNSCC